MQDASPKNGIFLYNQSTIHTSKKVNNGLIQFTVHTQTSPVVTKIFIIDEKNFEKQMKWLKILGYKTLTLDEFYAWKKGKISLRILKLFYCSFS